MDFKVFVQMALGLGLFLFGISKLLGASFGDMAGGGFLGVVDLMHPGWGLVMIGIGVWLFVRGVRAGDQ